VAVCCPNSPKSNNFILKSFLQLEHGLYILTRALKILIQYSTQLWAVWAVACAFAGPSTTCMIFLLTD
jgi:hypothetical protein